MTIVEMRKERTHINGVRANESIGSETLMKHSRESFQVGFKTFLCYLWYRGVRQTSFEDNEDESRSAVDEMQPALAFPCA